MTNDVEGCLRDALTTAIVRVRARWPALHALLVLCDVLVDRTVRSVATNGQDLLVHPDTVTQLTSEELQAALLGAVLDGAFLHAERPDGIDPLAWSLRTGRRTEQALQALGATTALGLTWHDRLRPPMAGVDLAQHWGRVRCRARQLAVPHRDTSLVRAGLDLKGPCLVCEVGGHQPFCHPQLEAILRGGLDAPAEMPARAMDGFDLIGDITRPSLPIESVLHGMEWLVRAGSDVWLQVAVVRLSSWTRGKGSVFVAMQQNPALRAAVQRGLARARDPWEELALRAPSRAAIRRTGAATNP